MKCINCSEVESCGSIYRELKSNSTTGLLKYIGNEDFECKDYQHTPISNAEIIDRTERLISKSSELRNALKQTKTSINRSVLSSVKCYK